MKILKIICILLCTAFIFNLYCYSDEEFNWYIVKKGNNTPSFPANAKDVAENGGIYIDINAANSCEKKLYLTFDAGYENGNIEKILDVMKEENVCGAFFILSNLIDKNPELVKRMSDEGHLVCNHTYNHKNLCNLSDEEIIANLKRLENKYKEVTGKDMEKIFRFPEGKYSIRTLKLLNENGYTSVILDTLKEKNVKAIFFVLEDYAEKNPELIERMIDEGHVIGNHSKSHYSMPELSGEKCKQEISSLHQYMIENFNYEMSMFRPPMGEFSEYSLAQTQLAGYQTVMWSFAYADWDVNNQPDYETAYEKLVNAIHPGAIYLLHSVSKTNAEVLPAFIDKMHSLGYEFKV